MNFKTLFAICAVCLILAELAAAQQQCTRSTCPWLITANGDFCTGITNLEDSVRHRLAIAGISVNKCPINGTEVGGLRESTLEALEDFAVEYGQPLVVSGGTEPLTHTDGTFGHANGYKVDLRVDASFPNDALSVFIIKHFDFIRFRHDVLKDGTVVDDPLYGTETNIGPNFAFEPGSIFQFCSNPSDLTTCRMLEADPHWDVQFPTTAAGVGSGQIAPLASNLTIAVTGSGSGLVNAELPSNQLLPLLQCPALGNCIRYTAGINFNLQAQPNSVSIFAGWSGAFPPDANPEAVKVDQDTTVTVEFDSQGNFPPPAGQGLCWTWNATLLGYGGYAWTGLCGPKPPLAGGTKPAQGCWHWDPLVGNFGAWIFDICGGSPLGNLSTITVSSVTSHDPNEKLGSQGVSTHQYLQRNQALRYAVFFSNLETATAPAQEITVTDQLDVTHDELASFSLGPVAFGNILISPPAGASAFSRIVDLRPGNNLLVKVEASLDSSTGLLTWRFTSLDPATGQPPLDPSAGFLPPGGEGSVFFTVLPKAGTSTNTQIKNQATIVFDANAPIPTQTWLNTIDSDKPVSHILVLPAQSSTSIPLRWVGTDVGAGVQDFTVYVSDDGGPFVPFVIQSTATSAPFPGQPGHTYGFFSTARDFVGNVEDMKTTAEATTTVVTDAIPPTTIAVVAPPANGNGWNNSNVSINLSATDNPGGSGVQQISFSATGGQAIPSTNLSGNSASATISNEGSTNFSFFATDVAGNIEPARTLPIRIDKTPPSINGSRTPFANANGWNNTDVTISFACADALSGLAAGSPPAPTLLTAEGANQQVTGTCQDLAGNTASAMVSGINIDKTPPVLSGLPTAGCTLWPPDHKFVTVATISGSDALSGLASLNVTGSSNEPMDPNDPDIIISGTGTRPRTVQLRADRLGTGTGRVYTLTTTATDVAGNMTTAVSTCTVPHDQGQ